MEKFKANKGGYIISRVKNTANKIDDILRNFEQAPTVDPEIQKDAESEAVALPKGYFTKAYPSQIVLR